MSKSDLKYKLKGNESFCIREGWLNKGITAIQNNETVFSSDEAMDILGLGSKMVKSLRYWLIATGLAVEFREVGRKTALRLTKDIGEVIWKYDKYFEDIFTLWITHYHIVSKLEFCTIWNLFFNNFNAKEFTKNNMTDKMIDEFNKIYDKGVSISNSVIDDCSSIIKMYCISDDDSKADPEDNLTSPFSELGLIKKNTVERGSYIKSRPVYAKLDRLVVLYIIVSNMTEEKTSVDIDTLMMQKNNVGKVLNLDRNMLNEYLDTLRQEGYITLNRTAGLDMVYLEKDLTPRKILEKYYTQIERDA